MDNSQKSIVLRNKEMNSQTSYTPTKKPNSQKNLSNRKVSNENSGGVSYAELQIIL